MYINVKHVALSISLPIACNQEIKQTIIIGQQDVAAVMPQGVLQVGPSLDDGPALANSHSRWAGQSHPVGHDGIGHGSCCASDAITLHDDLPNISPASSRHGAKRRGRLKI